MTDRALNAIIRYEQAARTLADLQKQIGVALSRCSVNIELDKALAASPQRDTSKLLVGDRVRTHLHEALTVEEPCDSGYGNRRLLGDEIGVWLEDSECAGCIEAWRLIVERKKVRQEFGIAKRVIRSIGRSAIKKEQVHE